MYIVFFFSEFHPLHLKSQEALSVVNLILIKCPSYKHLLFSSHKAYYRSDCCILFMTLIQTEKVNVLTMPQWQIVFNEYLFMCNHQLTYASDPECMFLQSAALLPESCYHLWAPPAGQQQSHAMLDSSCHSGQSAYTDDVPLSVGHVPAWPAHHMCSVTSWSSQVLLQVNNKRNRVRVSHYGRFNCRA